MTMRAMTTMTLLSALQAVAVKPVALDAAIPVAGTVSAGKREQPRFAETLTQAGVPSAAVLALTTTATVETCTQASVPRTPAFALLSEPSKESLPQANVSLAPTASLTFVPHSEELLQVIRPSTSPDAATLTSEAETDTSPFLATKLESPKTLALPKATGVVQTSTLQTPHVEEVQSEADEVVGAAPQTSLVAPEMKALGIEPPADVRETESLRPQLAPVNVLSTVAVPEAAITPVTRVATSVVSNTKVNESKEPKAKSSAVLSTQQDVSVTAMQPTNEVSLVAIGNAPVVAQQPTLPPVVQEPNGGITAPARFADLSKPVRGTASNQLIVPKDAANPLDGTPLPGQPAPEIEVASGAVTMTQAAPEQDKPLAAVETPLPVFTTNAAQRPSPGGMKATPQRVVPGHSIVTASSAPMASVAAPPLAVADSLPATHQMTQDAGIAVPVVSSTSIATAPLDTGSRATSAPSPSPWGSSALTDAMPVQSAETHPFAPPVLAHTTLNASPTVLEVGVPGGSQGWLKIRAEIGEGGNVQASLSAATHAGHETLQRELPQMNAFLAHEQLTVQVHVADLPQSFAANQGAERELAQSSTPGDRSGSEPRGGSHQDAATSSSSSGDEPEAAWTASDYGSSTALRGGSWVNVVA